MARSSLAVQRLAASLLSLTLFATAILAVPAAAQDKPAEAAPGPDDPEAAKPKPKPSRYKDRVFMKDLAGTWIARDYVERLRASRAPHATARQATGIAIKIEREGQSYPILITNFQRAVLMAVIDVQPTEKSNTYRLALAKEDRAGISSSELTYMPFRGERNEQGVFRTLSIAEPNFAKKRYLTYLRLDGPLDVFINRLVIAGKYVDAQGQAYEFTEGGEAILPGSKFAYEVSLDPSASRCEMIQSHRERDPEGKDRIGYAWQGAQLQLFRMTGSKAPYGCEAKPFAVLKPQ
jgi:hypothetical protein